MRIIAYIALGLIAFAGLGIAEFAVVAVWTAAGERRGHEQRTGKNLATDD